MKLTKDQTRYVRDLYKEIDKARRTLAGRKIKVPAKRELLDFIDEPDEYPYDEFGDAVSYCVGAIHGVAVALDGDTDELFEAAGIS